MLQLLYMQPKKLDQYMPQSIRFKWHSGGVRNSWLIPK